MSDKEDKKNSSEYIGLSAKTLSPDALKKGSLRLNRPSGREQLKLGLIMGEWGHMESEWARVINGVPGINNIPYTPKQTGMYCTHVWHINREKAETFAKQFQVDHVVNHFNDMIGKVDGIIIDVFFQMPWTYKLARPYLEAGIPVYIDRPFTDAVWKAKEMISLAEKYNTPLWSGSSLEVMYAASEAVRHNPPELITGYETWSEGEPDYYSHGLHGLWWSYRTAGGGIHAIAHKTKAWNKGGGTSTILYKDRGHGTFLGKITHYIRDDCIIYTKFEGNDRVYRCDYHIDWDSFIWTPMLYKIQGIFEMGMNGVPDTHDMLLEKMRFFLAGFRSILRENGEFVELDTLDEDWSVGCPWGQNFMSGMDVYRAYTKLFGTEKGEIRPPG